MSVVSTKASAEQQFITSSTADEFCEGLYRSSWPPGNWYASQLRLTRSVLPHILEEGVRGRGCWKVQKCPSPHGMKGDGVSLRCVCHGLLVRGHRMSLAHPLASGDQHIGDRQQHALRQGWLRLAALLHHPRKLGLAVQVALLFVGRLDQEIGVKHGSLLRYGPVSQLADRVNCQHMTGIRSIYHGKLRKSIVILILFQIRLIFICRA